MGTPPAAPPPDVEAFKENEEGEKALTVRESWKQHRANPSCNSCHARHGSSGFALENFDAIGAWRATDRYAGTPIDAAGQLVDGTARQRSCGLCARRWLANPEQFVQTLTEKLLMYALGRTVEYHDMPLVRQIVRDAARDGYRFSSIVKGIVESAPFQQSPDRRFGNRLRIKGETMFITKKHIPRRTFLRGIGATVALPLLDSMIPAATALAQTAASPKLRMGFIYFPHGAIMDQWTPKTAGKDFEISPILQPLEAYKKQLTIVSGLENKPATLAAGARAESRNLAELRFAAQDPGALCGDHHRPTGGRNVWGRTRRFRHSKSRPNPEAAAAPATATTAAAIRARSRSATPPRRCRWRPNPRNALPAAVWSGRHAGRARETRQSNMPAFST